MKTYMRSHINHCHPIARQLALLSAVAMAFGLSATAAPHADSKPAAWVRTPFNQVFQFVAHDPGSNARGFLWIPETCQRLRGLVVMCPNVPEHMLVGHPVIREACRRNDLGILWGSPSFMDSAGARGTPAALQVLLDGLAAVSGYDEVATVPWLPMGESGHLRMVQEIVDGQPSRCIAAVCLKNPRMPKTDRTVPMLFAIGTGYEWSQNKADLTLPLFPGEQWEYDQMGKHEATWPLSVIEERESGHFGCTEPMTRAIARYIDSASKARLSTDGSPNLRPVDMSKGYYADLPLPGHTKSAITQAAATPAAERGKPWYFDEACARDAQNIAAVDWTAPRQLPCVLAGANCVVKPWSPDIIHVDVSTSSEFSLDPILLDAVPESFVKAGAKLAKGPGKPTLEWLCGNVEPIGDNRFRVVPDRGYGMRFLILRAEASPGAGFGMQPVAINLVENHQGKPQKITFSQMPDIRRGAASVPLVATSDSGLPVRFFVVVGPAIMRENRLILTPVPPRAKYPVAVTVGAWQWGTNTEPKVQMADTAYQTFHIVN